MTSLPTVPRKVAYAAVLLTLAVLVGLGLRSAPASANGETGPIAIETRLLAPCCWNGTLDTHDSDLARTLRTEIETRVAHGEPGAQIEADLVDRYGTKMRALPHEDALKMMLAGAALLVLGVGAFLFSRVRKWRREGEASQPVDAPRASPVMADAYDARIDAELADVE